MARRYVNPNRPAQHESLLDRQIGERFSIAPGNVTDRDRKAFAIMRAGAAMSGLPRAQGRPYSATAALYDRKAPGAALAKQYRNVGELVQALYRAANGTGPKVVNAAMSERVGAEGGFLVGEELRSELMINVLESSIIRPRATVIPMRRPSSRVPVIEEGSDVSGSVFGGLNFTWTEEQAALSASVASYGLDVLRARKLISYMVCPNELMADADELGTFLRETIPAGLAFAEDAAFIAGSGTLGGTTLGASQPLGILNAGSAITVTRQTGGTVTLQDIYSMITRILPKSMNSYIWLGSPDVVTKILAMFFNFGSATTGIVPPSGWLTWSPEGQLQLLGRPFYTTEHVSALGTQGDLVAVDPSLYLIGDYQTLEIEVATEGADFINDQALIRIKARLDGRPALAQAVTPANSSATVSPIIVLK
jgi:HK97 family phage major capsid protein